jgi:ketosteroid isomerase-like protein
VARDLLEQFRRLYRVAPGALPEHYSEDLVIEQDRDVPGTGGTFRGHAGLLSLMAELGESYTDIVWRPDKVVELGDDRYLVLVTATGKGARSGIPLTDTFSHIVKLDERGRFLRIQAYLGWDRGYEEARSISSMR